MLPAASSACRVQIVEDLRVVALRHLASGAVAVEAALAAHGRASLPEPGVGHGADLWVAWVGSTKSLLLMSHGAVFDGVCDSLPPDPHTPINVINLGLPADQSLIAW